MSEEEINDTDNLFNELPCFCENGKCGYYHELDNETLVTMIGLLQTQYPDFSEQFIFGKLLQNGFRRSGAYMYTQQCETCMECVPIRLKVDDFIMSKSQRVAYRKNGDLSVNICTDPDMFVSDEKALMFREYDNYHNHDDEGYVKKTLEESKETLSYMNGGYSGVMNMEYRLNGKLIGVAILDYSEDENGRMNAISSNYFYYDVSPEILKRSIGVFSVLKEIELCHKLGVPYYYLGLYLPHCRKMNYKINYKPYELMICNVWSENTAELCKEVCDEFRAGRERLKAEENSETEPDDETDDNQEQDAEDSN